MAAESDSLEAEERVRCALELTTGATIHLELRSRDEEVLTDAFYNRPSTNYRMKFRAGTDPHVVTAAGAEFWPEVAFVRADQIAAVYVMRRS